MRKGEALPRVELECLNCSQKHYKLQCQLGRGRGKYCSKKCKQEHSKTKVIVKCAQCKKEFKKFPCELDCEKSFCCKSCYDTYRRRNMSKNTYMMKGGVHEHRAVAEHYLGRKLTADEIVHHIDEDKHNNLP